MKTPSEWLELSVEAPPEFVEPLSQIFLRYGNGGVAVEEDGGYNPDEGEVAGQRRATIRTYVPMDSTAPERRSQIDIAVRLIASLAPVSVLTERVLKEEEWQTAWKRYFKSLHIGENLVVRPSWLADVPEDGEVTIWLDPGMAFGTGYHPTTSTCLEALEKHLSPGDEVLDLGTGSGILAIAAARLGAASVVALDVDPIAVSASRKNFKAGGLSQVRPGRGTLPHRLAQPAHFDLATANISAKTVREMAGRLRDALKSGGTLIASGIIQRQEDEVRSAVTEAGFQHTETICVDDWVTILFSRAG